MTNSNIEKFIYWVPAADINDVEHQLTTDGYQLQKTHGSQCGVLKCSGKKLGHAEPAGFNRMCKRQGSWYRDSTKSGMHLIVGDHKLPALMNAYLEVTMAESDFRPKRLPNRIELKEVVDAPEYQDKRPEAWNKHSIMDKLGSKILFTLTGFWGRGDNLKSTWLGHQANHANFLAKRYTTNIEGEDVAYSVTENAAVCSSCVEFFNLVSEDSRKLVRSCPGSITLSGAKRDIYYDVRPVKNVR